MTHFAPDPFRERVRAVLDAALEHAPADRARFVDDACGGDRDLHHEVRSLLEALDRGGERLEPPSFPACGEPEPPAASLEGLRFRDFIVGERLGAGGMGVVHRAVDTRLARTVAVKALPASLVRDPHGRARFEREARMLASLNHPNIAAIHGIEESERGPVLVLEFVPGTTLAARLAEGPLPIDEAVRIAVEIARGLEAAHDEHLVHRDLKPSNIQLTPKGNVKILDFGIADRRGPRDRDERSGFVTGTPVGTAAYMSPEQRLGRDVDRRSDLWAFGCILLEMLTGARPVVDPGHALPATPNLSHLPPATPAHVRRVLRRCLMRDPELRQRDAGDAALELLGVGEGKDEGTPGQQGVRTGVLVAGWACAALLLTALLWPRRPQPPAPTAAARFTIQLGAEAAMHLTPGGAFALSPDGRSLAFAGGPLHRTKLFIRTLDDPAIVPLRDTDGALDPCFGPDGRWIAYRAGQALKRVPAGGGPSETLMPDGVRDIGFAWDDRGIVFGGVEPIGLKRLSADGSIESLFVERDRWQYRHPEPIPGGGLLLTAIAREDGRATARIDALAPGAAETTLVLENASNPRFLPPDRLLFQRDGALLVVRFDPIARRATAPPEELVRPLAGGEAQRPPRFALARSGVLATIPGGIQYAHTLLAWRGSDGAWTDLTRCRDPIDAVRIAPDGSRVALLAGRTNGDLWSLEPARGTLVRLTTDDDHHHPVWSADGRHILFTTAHPGERVRIESVIHDGSEPPRAVYVAPMNDWIYPTDSLADGRIVVSFDPGGPEVMDIYSLDPGDGGPPTRLFASPANRYGARVSPDGTMIAYTSEETGSPEVYVQRFPALDAKVRVSPNGGYRPVWSRDGARLYFRRVESAMCVDVVEAEDGIAVSPMRVVAEDLPDARYDIGADDRLLLPRPDGPIGPQTAIDITLGLFGR